MSRPLGAALGAPCCVKTLVQARDLALAETENGPLVDLVSSAVLLAPEPSGRMVFSERGSSSELATIEGPPPTELITVLHRFLI